MTDRSASPTARIKAVARRARSGWRLRREFAQDRRATKRHSAPEDGASRDRILSLRELETQLTKDYHRVEKGLALARPKQPFGADVRDRLEALVPAARQRGTSAAFVEYAESALQALDSWNGHGVRNDAVAPLNPRSEHGPDVETAFSQLALGRRSVRHFKDQDVDRSIIERALTIAGTTPSVCNRQAWSATIATDRALVREILRHQNGNRGFGDDVPCVAVISVDRRLFAGAAERNQPWIEGGLFSMSFVLALESVGLATCMLNLSRLSAELRPLRELIGSDDSDVLIMMIAIGYPADGHRVARSPRRLSNEFVRWL